jgi:hypothetical protein
MLNQNCLRPNVLNSLSPSRGFAQTLKVLALGLFCFGCFLVFPATVIAQPSMPPALGDTHGEGSIIEFTRYVNGVAKHRYFPGDRISVTAKGDVNNTEDYDVAFHLVATIWINDATHPQNNQQVAHAIDETVPLPPEAQAELIVNTRGLLGNKYFTPVILCPGQYRARAALGSSRDQVMGLELDSIEAVFVKR